MTILYLTNYLTDFSFGGLCPKINGCISDVMGMAMRFHVGENVFNSILVFLEFCS